MGYYGLYGLYGLAEDGDGTSNCPVNCPVQPKRSGRSEVMDKVLLYWCTLSRKKAKRSDSRDLFIILHYTRYFDDDDDGNDDDAAVFLRAIGIDQLTDGSKRNTSSLSSLGMKR
ncbi:hypothetical protein CIB48_g1202 [Xylaria polymorpha]|nr:hypothetical protein CIB48_g1202 [Xylaria polymorpha]